MKFIFFVLMISVASRLLWSRRLPYGNLKYELRLMGLTIFLNLLWFSFCSLAFNITFP